MKKGGKSSTTNRTDRLFELIQIMRDGQLHLARDIAAQLSISQRTVYRDMDTLIDAGLPIEGERGVGYTMTTPISIPPLHLTPLELEALHVGLAIVQQTADRELQAGARSFASKIESVVPKNRSAPPMGWDTAVYPFAEALLGFDHMPLLRQAIRQKRKIWLDYKDEEGRRSQRMIRPLQLEYWGRVWSCPAWCERQKGFQSFRVDQMHSVELTSARFREENGKAYPDFLASLTLTEG
ncbi:MAG: YafY family protein [Pseudoruegeria sp.]